MLEHPTVSDVGTRSVPDGVHLDGLPRRIRELVELVVCRKVCPTCDQTRVAWHSVSGARAGETVDVNGQQHLVNLCTPCMTTQSRRLAYQDARHEITVLIAKWQEVGETGKARLARKAATIARRMVANAVGPVQTDEARKWLQRCEDFLSDRGESMKNPLEAA